MMVAARAWSEALVTAPCLKPCPVSRLATSLARPLTGVPLRTATVTVPRANAGLVPEPVFWAVGVAEAEVEEDEPESPPPISWVRPNAPAARTSSPTTRPTSAQRRARKSLVRGPGADREAVRRAAGAGGGRRPLEPVVVRGRGRGTGGGSVPRPLARAGASGALAPVTAVPPS